MTRYRNSNAEWADSFWVNALYEIGFDRLPGCKFLVYGDVNLLLARFLEKDIFPIIKKKIGYTESDLNLEAQRLAKECCSINEKVGRKNIQDTGLYQKDELILFLAKFNIIQKMLGRDGIVGWLYKNKRVCKKLDIAILLGDLYHPLPITVVIGNEIIFQDYPRGEDALYMTFTLISRQAEIYWRKGELPPKLKVFMMSKVGGLGENVKTGDLVIPTSVLSLSPEPWGSMSLHEFLNFRESNDIFGKFQEIIEAQINMTMENYELSFPNFFMNYSHSVSKTLVPSIHYGVKSGYVLSVLSAIHAPYLEQLKIRGVDIFEMELYFLAKLIEGMNSLTFIFHHEKPDIGFVGWVGWTPLAQERLLIDDDFPISPLLAADILIKAIKNKG